MRENTISRLIGSGRGISRESGFQLGGLLTGRSVGHSGPPGLLVVNSFSEGVSARHPGCNEDFKLSQIPPNYHARKIVHIVDARNGCVRFGFAENQLGDAIPLELLVTL